MTSQNDTSARRAWQVGDRVKVWIGPENRGYWLRGAVVGIDDGPRPGIRVDDGGVGCYALHAEVVGDDLPPMDPAPAGAP